MRSGPHPGSAKRAGARRWYLSFLKPSAWPHLSPQDMYAPRKLGGP